MRWKVNGANRTTGQDVEIIVDADTRDEAVRKAGVTGMIISEVVLIAEPVSARPSTAPPPARMVPVIPTNLTTPIVPIMLVKPPHRWGVKCWVGLGLVVVGLPMLACAGTGLLPIAIGAYMMIQGD